MNVKLNDNSVNVINSLLGKGYVISMGPQVDDPSLFFAYFSKTDREGRYEDAGHSKDINEAISQAFSLTAEAQTFTFTFTFTFKVGDKVKCINNDEVGSALTLGTIYEVLGVTSITVLVKNNIGSGCYYYLSRFEKVESPKLESLPIEALAPTMKQEIFPKAEPATKFKKGELVECIDNDEVGSALTRGKTYEVLDSTLTDVIIKDNTEAKRGFFAHRFKKVDLPKPAEIPPQNERKKLPLFKEGDLVECVNNKGYKELVKGEVYTVEYYEEDRSIAALDGVFLKENPKGVDLGFLFAYRFRKVSSDRAIKGTKIPARELWLHKNKKAKASLQRGLRDSAEGRAKKVPQNGVKCQKVVVRGKKAKKSNKAKKSRG